ncbi:39047_t:CDS:1, partial [Gigaspora margarita]
NRTQKCKRQRCYELEDESSELKTNRRFRGRSQTLTKVKQK